MNLSGVATHSPCGDSTVVAVLYGRSGVAFLGNTPYVPAQAMRSHPKHFIGHTFLYNVVMYF
jgi:hypothetical protein